MGMIEITLVQTRSTQSLFLVTIRVFIPFGYPINPGNAKSQCTVALFL